MRDSALSFDNWSLRALRCLHRERGAADATRRMTMYGTVARLKLQSGKEEEFIAQNAVYKDLNIPGFIATAVYRADAGDGEYWMAVVFDSKESYRANAEDPAQDQRFR
jgi:antibiotic biosynthesis monooxygenase (ABM) superfamily enzyme